jgi:hypothetical protein
VPTGDPVACPSRPEAVLAAEDLDVVRERGRRVEEEQGHGLAVAAADRLADLDGQPATGVDQLAVQGHVARADGLLGLAEALSELGGGRAQARLEDPQDDQPLIGVVVGAHAGVR